MCVPLIVAVQGSGALASASTARGAGQAGEGAGGQGSRSSPFCGRSQADMLGQ